MTPIAWLYLSTAAVCWIVIVKAAIARPSKILLALAVLATSFFVSGAVKTYTEYLRIGPRSLATFYTLDVHPDGIHTLHIKPVADVPGLSVKAVPKGLCRDEHTSIEDKLPVSQADIISCGWKVLSPSCQLHLHDARCVCDRKHILLDTGIDKMFQDGTVDTIYLEYQANDRTRPILESIDLEVGYPLEYGEDLAFQRINGQIVGIPCAIGATLGLLGITCQVWRLRWASGAVPPFPPTSEGAP